MKAFMIAGVSSGIGKTTISMALMSAFNNVSPFKVGPDYIDPGFHEFITGNKSYNLDIFMMGEQGVKYSFYKHHKDISIIEGVMGLYDGMDNSLDNNSSAHISRFLGVPVILVLDGVGKSTSIAAQVLGYKMLDPRVNIAGVIINKVSSAKTYAIFKEAIEKYTGVKCLGFVEKNDKLNISSRHLGLLQANEVEDLREKLSILRNHVLQNIDLKEIEKIASEQTRNFNENKDEIVPPLRDRLLQERPPALLPRAPATGLRRVLPPPQAPCHAGGATVASRAQSPGGASRDWPAVEVGASTLVNSSWWASHIAYATITIPPQSRVNPVP